MEPQERVRLSKALALALRHKPWLFELELDDQGWTPVEHLLEGLRRSGRSWNALDERHLQEVIDTSSKQRYELHGGKIRALYGHSVPGRITRTPGAPPALLYHGTSQQTLAAIRMSGLRPMSRQYVHLSIGKQMALEVGRRKGSPAIILEIAAAEAHAHGIPFYRGNEMVWLADQVPPQFILFPDPAD